MQGPMCQCLKKKHPCCCLQVQCGFDSTLVLSEDGTLFTFGDNSLHQLGRASRVQVTRDHS